MMIGTMKITNGTFDSVGVEPRRKPGSPKTRCPNCDSIIKVAKPCGGAVIACPRCGVELEIINADPFEVDFTEDWQNEWEG
jgi:lysine biosynthesis protein LysW